MAGPFTGFTSTNVPILTRVGAHASATVGRRVWKRAACPDVARDRAGFTTQFTCFTVLVQKYASSAVERRVWTWAICRSMPRRREGLCCCARGARAMAQLVFNFRFF